jgi:zinc protease
VLGNGLRLVVAPDRSSPLVGVAVVYDVGFRSEPEGRTGFAHLFEHLMFQGSAQVKKMEHAQLVEAAGGVMNGHTLPDLTAYYEAVPAGALELALWLEADRMGSLAVSEENLRNQVAVVEEEIKVNVYNRPYGGFPWIPLPEVAFTRYPNAHNGYGDFEHLEEATLDEARDFYHSYYTPANAVLAVAGDCSPDEVISLAERHFGPIAGRDAPDRGPWPEPEPKSERRAVRDDRLAVQPAFVAGYRVPDPIAHLEDYLAWVVLAEVLGQGDSSRLRSRLMYRDNQVTDVACLVGTFGSDTFMMRDPVLSQVLVFHPGRATTDELLQVIDEEVGLLAREGPRREELERVAAGYSAAHWREQDSVLNRALEMSSLEVIHGRAELAYELPQQIAEVTGAAVATAAGAMAGQHRSLVELRPGAGR